MRKTIWLAALPLLGPACGAPAEPRAVSEVVLSIGREARVDSLLRVGFLSVPADSRCPTTVFCILAGDGAAEIAYGVGEGPSYFDTLHTTQGPRTVEFAGYVITLLDLMPYPFTPDPIPPDEYAVRLRIERRK